MFNEEGHISDQELLQALDGELSSRRAGQVHAHLSACWNCRARSAAMEGTITDFVGAHRNVSDSQLPSADGPRALLRAQLAELAAKPAAKLRPGVKRRLPSAEWSARAAAIVLAVLTAALAGRLMLHPARSNGATGAARALATEALPKEALTPGATRPVTVSDVCSMPQEEVVREVPAALRQQVLKEYGIANARPGDFEIDYLITPGLGGADDIHNLWPQPYSSQTWNARVKDSLEQRLHQLVCAGDLDLPTAQRDIARDWIAAYRKYFHTDLPLPVQSRPVHTPVDPPAQPRLARG